MIVLIDAQRDFLIPKPDTQILRTLDAALEWLKSTPAGAVVDQLWMDHDLGATCTTIPVIALLEERYWEGSALQIRTLFVHATNRVGRDSIVRALSPYAPVIRVPFDHYLTSQTAIGEPEGTPYHEVSWHEDLAAG